MRAKLATLALTLAVMMEAAAMAAGAAVAAMAAADGAAGVLPAFHLQRLLLLSPGSMPETACVRARLGTYTCAGERARACTCDRVSAVR